MNNSKHIYVSASTERAAAMLVAKAKEEMAISGWTYVPLGNSYEREEIFYPLKRVGVNRDQLLGYYKDSEIESLTGSI